MGRLENQSSSAGGNAMTMARRAVEWDSWRTRPGRRREVGKRAPGVDGRLENAPRASTGRITMYADLETDALTELVAQLEREHAAIKARKLSLNMARGKPARRPDRKSVV